MASTPPPEARRALPKPTRGDVWDFDPAPTRGHEQDGSRPCVVLGADWFNALGTGMAFLVPSTRTDRGLTTRVQVAAGIGGLSYDSFFMCDQARFISVERPVRRRGALPPGDIERISEVLRAIIGLQVGRRPWRPLRCGVDAGHRGPTTPRVTSARRFVPRPRPFPANATAAKTSA